MNRASSNINENHPGSEFSQGYEGIRGVRLEASGCLALDVLDQCAHSEVSYEDVKNGCKIHQNQKAMYFLKGEPWQKFCK